MSSMICMRVNAPVVRFGKGPDIVDNGRLQFRDAVLIGGSRVDVDSLESRIIYIM